jgi:PAS domain S-box-containing protein
MGGITGRHPDGTPASVTGIVIDITERKLAEEKLRESETRYRLIYDTAREGIWGVDADYRILYVNPHMADILGYSVPEILGRHVTDFVTDSEKPDAEQRFERRRTGLAEQFERRFTRKDGTIITLLVSATPLLGDNGTFMGSFAMFTDITGRKKIENALRESEEKFRTVADYTYDWEYWRGDDGRYRYVSPSVERITGYHPDAFYEDPALMEKIIHPDDRRVFQEHAASLQVTADGEDFTEFRIITRDGRTVWIGHLCRPIIGNDGKFLGRRGSNRDITERKLAEGELRQNETRFRALIQNSSDIIRILNREGRIIYESDSAERILGYPASSLIGRNPLEFIHPDDLERVKQDFRNVLERTNPGTSAEFRIRKNDGEFVWVDSIATNLLDIPGVNGIVITTRPIQQRKEAELALNESEERLRLALEGAEIASWDWDLPSGNSVFSDRFYTMLGYEPREFPATYEGWTALIHPDDRDRVLPDLRRQIEEKRPLCEIEFRLLSKDGHWFWIQSRGKIVGTDEAGNATRLTGVNIDITNRKLMESEIRSLNIVLEQRVRDRTEALAKTNEALEEEISQRQEAEKKLKGSYDEKVLLLKEVHHRVKNNLQIIASLLSLQSRYIKDESSRAVIRESQNRVRAMALVHEKLYRSEDLAHISLYDYIRFLGTGLFQFYDAKPRGIQFMLDIRDVNVDIDTAIPLGLVINELISNSLKYAFPDGRNGEIFISVKKERHTLTVVYRDNGIGIPGDLDWRDTQSLGLRLVNTLVDQLNGTVELDRSAGTQFTMVLQEKELRGPS